MRKELRTCASPGKQWRLLSLPLFKSSLFPSFSDFSLSLEFGVTQSFPTGFLISGFGSSETTPGLCSTSHAVFSPRIAFASFAEMKVPLLVVPAHAVIVNGKERAIRVSDAQKMAVRILRIIWLRVPERINAGHSAALEKDFDMHASLPKWFADFWAARSLTGPTGKPLYAYGMTAEEFEGLRFAINDALRFSTWEPFRRKPMLAAAYLLFAAAEISRVYSSGAWRWELVDGVFEKQFHQDDHAAMVELGAAYWGLRHQLQEEGKRYIGFIMLQAGLPLRALEHEAGWSRGIGDCLRFLADYPEASDGILKEHIRAAIPCPDSFDEDHFVELLANASRALARALESMPENPGEADYEKAYNGIRYKFPAFHFEPRHLRLIAEARRASEKLSTPLFCVNRFIDWDPDGESAPQLCAAASLARKETVVGARHLADFLTDAAGPRPNEAARISINGKIFLLMQRQETASEAEPSYRIIRCVPYAARGAAAAKSLLALMNWPTGHSGEVIFGSLGALDPDEPACFVRSPNSTQWRSIGAGSVSTPAGRILLACRADARLTATEEAAELKALGSSAAIRLIDADWLSVGGKTLSLYEVRASVRAASAGDAFEIRLRSGTAIERAYWFRGRFFGLTEEGREMFRGEPEIFSARGKEKATWRLPDGRKVPAGLLPTDSPVPAAALIEENGRIVKRMRCIVLPENAKTITNIGQGRPGSITLENWGAICVTPADPAVLVEETPKGARLACPLRDRIDDMKPLSVLVTPGDSARSGMWQFRLQFDYPQRILAFVLDNERWQREEELSLDQVRSLRAYAVVPPQKAQDVVLELMAHSQCAVGDKDLRIDLPVPINPFTSSGALLYEEFRGPLFRLMRVAGKDSYVSLRLFIEGCVRETVQVVHESERLHYEASIDALYCSINVERTLRFVPFLEGEADSPAPLDLVAEPRAWLKLSELLPFRDQPWFVYDTKDPKHRLHPTLLPPSNPNLAAMDWPEEMRVRFSAERRLAGKSSTAATVSPTPGSDAADVDGSPAQDFAAAGEAAREAPDSLQAVLQSGRAADFKYQAPIKYCCRFRYLGMSSVWLGGTPSDKEYEAASRVTEAILRDPARPEGAVFISLWHRFNRRGLALLPFWNLLQRDVPLALALAIALEFLLPGEAENRSLLFSLGRYKTWRWDFVSIREMGRVIGLVRDFWLQCGMSETTVNDRLRRITELDAALDSPVFRDKCRHAMLISGLHPDYASLQTDDPFMEAARARRLDEECLRNILTKHSDRARSRLRGLAAPPNLGPGDTQAQLEALLEAHDRRALAFARRCGLSSVRLSENARADSAMKALILGDFAWSRGYALSASDPGLLFGLAKKRLFFCMETLYDVDELWTAWATSFASAMALAFEQRAQAGR